MTEELLMVLGDTTNSYMFEVSASAMDVRRFVA
jgi:hypothetical protein